MDEGFEVLLEGRPGVGSDDGSAVGEAEGRLLLVGAVVGESVHLE